MPKIDKVSKKRVEMIESIRQGDEWETKHPFTQITVELDSLGDTKTFRLLKGFEGCDNRQIDQSKLKGIASSYQTVSKNVILLRMRDSKGGYFYILDGQHRIQLLSDTLGGMTLQARIFDSLDEVPDLCSNMKASKLYRFLHYINTPGTNPPTKWTPEEHFETRTSKSPWVPIFSKMGLLDPSNPMTFTHLVVVNHKETETIKWPTIMKAYLVSLGDDVSNKSIGTELQHDAFIDAPEDAIKQMGRFLKWWIPIAIEWHRALGLGRTSKAGLLMFQAPAICVGFRAFTENVDIQNPNPNCTHDRLIKLFKEGMGTGVWFLALQNKGKGQSGKSGVFFVKEVAKKFLDVANKGLTKNSAQRSPSRLITLWGKSVID